MRAQRPCTHDPLHGKGSSTEGRNGLLDPLVVPLLQCANLGSNEIGRATPTNTGVTRDPQAHEVARPVPLPLPLPPRRHTTQAHHPLHGTRVLGRGTHRGATARNLPRPSGHSDTSACGQTRVGCIGQPPATHYAAAQAGQGQGGTGIRPFATRTSVHELQMKGTHSNSRGGGGHRKSVHHTTGCRNRTQQPDTHACTHTHTTEHPKRTTWELVKGGHARPAASDPCGGTSERHSQCPVSSCLQYASTGADSPKPSPTDWRDVMTPTSSHSGIRLSVAETRTPERDSDVTHTRFVLRVVSVCRCKGAGGGGRWARRCHGERRE